MGAFEQLIGPVRGEFEQHFSKTSNARGVARGGGDVEASISLVHNFDKREVEEHYQSVVMQKEISETLILSHWDRLPLELRQTIQWMADRQQAHDRLKHGWHSIHLHFEPCYICHRLLVINDQHHTLANFPLMHIWKPPHPHHILIHFPLGHQWQPPHSPRLYHHYCMMDPPLS